MERQARRWVWLALVVLVWAMGGAAGWAAEEEAGRLHFVGTFEDQVKPEMMEAYMKGAVASARLSAEYKGEMPYLTFVNGFKVFSCGIFTKFAQLDDFNQRMEAWNQKTGGKAEQINRQIAKCVSTCATSIMVFRPDLSYMPENPAFVTDFSKPFYQVATFYHVKQDQHDQAQEVARKIKALKEKNKSPMGWWAYECVFGLEVPTFIEIAQAKDKAAFVELDQKIQANADPALEKLFAEGAAVLTKIETREGTFVPEASYVPEGTF